MSNGPTKLEDSRPVAEVRATRLRHALMDRIERECRPWKFAVWSTAVLRAMREVPRHLLAPQLTLEQAYRDRAQPIGYGQTISQPSMVALMSNALGVTGAERVLEVGTGSGYQTAILSHLCAQVYSVERIEALAGPTRERLQGLGRRNIQFRLGDGSLGWVEEAPFDRIVLTAAPPTLPPQLLQQHLPVRDEHQAAVGQRMVGGAAWPTNCPRPCRPRDTIPQAIGAAAASTQARQASAACTCWARA